MSLCHASLERRFAIGFFTREIINDKLQVLVVSIITPARSLGQGNIFTSVCHSVHRREGWLPSTYHRSHEQGVCIGGGGLHPGVLEVGQTLPPARYM